MSRHAPLLAAAAAVVLTVAFWFFGYSPRHDEQVALESETEQLATEQQRLRLEVARLEEIKEDEERFRAQLARLGEYIPDGVEQPAAVRAFQEAADAAGVEILSVSFGDPVLVEEAPETADEGTALASIATTMTLDGGYFQAVDFLRRVEVDVTRAVLVGDLAITEGVDGFPALSTTWSGDLFTVVPVTEATAPKDVAPPDADAPEADTPDADTPDADTPDADTPDADTPDADTPDADTPDADTPDAEGPDADGSADGELAAGDAASDTR